MNLVIDIGNSSVKAAVFDHGCLIHRERLDKPEAAHLATLLTTYPVEACAYASVGAEADALLTTLRARVPSLLHVTGATPAPIACSYRTPQTLGADRWAAAVGAASLSPHRALLIIDVGTCITCDYVSASGCYLGGNISPGLGMRLRALHDQTARLPLVSSRGECPQAGTDTETAIRSGALLGMQYEIDGYIRHFVEQHVEGRVYLTGGNAPRFGQGWDVERHDALVETGLDCLLRHHLPPIEK